MNVEAFDLSNLQDAQRVFEANAAFYKMVDKQQISLEQASECAISMTRQMAEQKHWRASLRHAIVSVGLEGDDSLQTILTLIPAFAVMSSTTEKVEMVDAFSTIFEDFIPFGDIHYKTYRSIQGIPFPTGNVKTPTIWKRNGSPLVSLQKAFNVFGDDHFHLEVDKYLRRKDGLRRIMDQAEQQDLESRFLIESSVIGIVDYQGGGWSDSDLEYVIERALPISDAGSMVSSMITNALTGISVSRGNGAIQPVVEATEKSPRDHWSLVFDLVERRAVRMLKAKRGSADIRQTTPKIMRIFSSFGALGYDPFARIHGTVALPAQSNVYDIAGEGGSDMASMNPNGMGNAWINAAILNADPETVVRSQPSVKAAAHFYKITAHQAYRDYLVGKEAGRGIVLSSDLGL